jgi:DNA-binding Xre family transcriptional regulator
MAVLTEDAVLDILAAPRDYGTGHRLAEQYGVSPATISLIRTGKTWRHLEAAP